MLKETVSWCKPTKATKYSACVDLYAKEDIIIGAGCTSIVNLGVKIDLELFIRNWFAIADDRSINDVISDKSIGIGDTVHKFLQSHYIELHPRSSLRAKGLIIGVGVIDLDYPDEIGLIVNNPVRYYENFKNFKPNGDSNRSYFYITDNGLIGDNIWENSYSDNRLYKEGKIFKNWEQAKFYKDNYLYTINKGDKIAQCTLVEHKGYLLGIESDAERSGGFGSTGM